MKKLFAKDVLAVWASLGLIVMLCGAWVLPSNKLYHQLLTLLLWLPAVLALLHRDVRRMLKQPEWWLFAAFMVWTLVVLAFKGGEDVIGKAKVTLYVALTLLGIVLAAQSPKWRVEAVLFYSSILGGVFALVSLTSFYLLAEQPINGRLVAVGLWDTAIMAAHAVGALAILGLCVVQARRCSPWVMLLLLIPAFGYVAFLGFSQTRGVWIALATCLLVMSVARPSRLGTGLVALAVLGLAVIALLQPHILLQRGLSYRPQLWGGGMQLLLDHWAMGLGFHEYWIPVEQLDRAFKHPHNLFLDTGVREGVIGLLLFGWLWLAAGWRGWTCRAQPLGRALLALWVFAGASLMTDGIGLWLKPNADWLITWLPIGLSMVLAARVRCETDANAVASPP